MGLHICFKLESYNKPQIMNLCNKRKYFIRRKPNRFYVKPKIYCIKNKCQYIINFLNMRHKSQIYKKLRCTLAHPAF